MHRKPVNLTYALCWSQWKQQYTLNNILNSILSSGSNGDIERASSTNPKSHQGQNSFEIGKAERVLFMNLHTKGCCPTGLLSKPMWKAWTAAINTFMVENTLEQNDRTTATEHWKGIWCFAAHQCSNHTTFAFINRPSQWSSRILYGSDNTVRKKQMYSNCP